MEDKQTAVFGTVSALSDSLAKAAGVTVVLSGYAYYLGWAMKRSYFLGLGAEWFVALLPTTTFLFESGGLILLMGLSAFVSTQSGTLKGMTGIQILTLAAALILLTTRWWPVSWIGSKGSWFAACAGVVAFAWFCGTCLAELVFSLSQSGNKWTTRHLGILQPALVLSLIFMPTVYGHANARYHLDSAEDVLPLWSFQAHKVPARPDGISSRRPATRRCFSRRASIESPVFA